MSVPPPPPPGPPPPSQNRAPAQAGRGALLQSIEGFKKGGLKKTVTVDKSAPVVKTTNNANASPAIGSSGGGSSREISSTPQLGGIFAGGIPSLKKTGLPGASSMLPSKNNVPPVPAATKNSPQTSTPAFLSPPKPGNSFPAPNVNKPVLRPSNDAPALANNNTIPSLKSLPTPTTTPIQPQIPRTPARPPPPASLINQLASPTPPIIASNISAISLPAKPVNIFPLAPTVQGTSSPSLPALPKPDHLLTNLTHIKNLPPVPVACQTKPIPSPPSIFVGNANPTVFAVALYPFSAQQTTDLTLDVGDIIVIINKNTNTQWWEGTAKNKTGQFPSTFVKELSVIETVSVKNNFKPTNYDEMALNIGETIHVLHKFDHGWWFGTSQKAHGLFPYNYVTNSQKVNQSHVPVNQSGFQPLKSIHNHSNGQERPQEPSGRVVDPNYNRQALVLMDFNAQLDTDLTIKRGQTITIVSSSGAWWVCTLNGLTGNVPGNYLQLL